MKKVPVSKLVLDYILYPRGGVDSQHVSYMLQSLEAGCVLPPIVVCKKTYRVADGFHRVTAIKRHTGGKGKVDCIFVSYKDDEAFFLDAMRYNSGHGRTLTQYDRVRCIQIAEELHIDVELIANALNVTVARVEKLRTERIGELHVSPHIAKIGKDSKKKGRAVSYVERVSVDDKQEVVKVPIPLKRTIQHKAGQMITEKQFEVNKKLDGHDQLFTVNQLIDLIEADLIDTSRNKLMERIAYLHSLISDLLPNPNKRKRAVG